MSRVFSITSMASPTGDYCGENRSISLRRELQDLKNLNYQLTTTVENLKLKVLKLEKENIRQHLIITRLIEENLGLRRLNSPLVSSELLECKIKCCCDEHYSRGQKNTIDLVGDDKSCLLLQSISQMEQVSALKYIREVGGGHNGRVTLVEVNGLHCITKRPRSTTAASSSRCALKVLDSFHRELQVLPQLHHPNIIQFLGVNSVPNEFGSLALVMEYLPVDLDNLLSACQGHLPLPLQLSILLDISLGMWYLHTRGIVHCDLTPDNILLSSVLRAKIADLGSSKPLGSRDITGYPHIIAPNFRTYMPPEVFEPNFLYTEKLDVFTYGVLALYVATQMFPVCYMGGEVSEEAMERGEVELERHREVFSMLDQSHCLTSLIRECLQDDRDKRIHPADIAFCLKSWLKVYPKQLEHVMELNTVIRDCLCAL